MSHAWSEQVRELRAALEGAEEAICRLDLEGRLTWVNQAFNVMAQSVPGSAVGQSWETLVAPQHRDAVRAHLRTAGPGKVEHEIEGLRADFPGTTFEMQLSIVPIPRDRDRATPVAKGHYFYLRDLTDRKRMENQLIFAGRMAAVGTLAAGVAHEINNPLAYIVANIDFARHQITTVASRLSRSSAGGRASAHALDESGRR